MVRGVSRCLKANLIEAHASQVERATEHVITRVNVDCDATSCMICCMGIRSQSSYSTAPANAQSALLMSSLLIIP